MTPRSHDPRVPWPLYLKQRPGRVLQVQHQAWAVPEGQGVAEKDDKPHVAREKAHDQPLADAPALGQDQVTVVPAGGEGGPVTSYEIHNMER